MNACSTACGQCGMCSAAWEREHDERDPFACIRCEVECELDDFEPFCSQDCKDNYDGPPDDAEAWSGGFADNH